MSSATNRVSQIQKVQSGRNDNDTANYYAYLKRLCTSNWIHACFLPFKCSIFLKIFVKFCQQHCGKGTRLSFLPFALSIIIIILIVNVCYCQVDWHLNAWKFFARIELRDVTQPNTRCNKNGHNNFFCTIRHCLWTFNKLAYFFWFWWTDTNRSLNYAQNLFRKCTQKYSKA